MKGKRLTIFTLITAAAVLLLDSPVQAQRGQRGRGRFGFRQQAPSVVGLAANPAVQKELGLGAEQIEKVGEVSQAYREELRNEMQGLGFSREDFQDLSGEERRQKIRELREKRATISRKLNEKYRAKLSEVLEAEQIERLKQIAWQAAGSAALSDPELVTALGLTKEQQDRLVAVSREYAQKTRELFRGGFQGGQGGSREERFEKVRKLQEEREAKQSEVLTEDQQKKLKQLQGKPFDVAQLRGRFGQGGRRRPDRD